MAGASMKSIKLRIHSMQNTRQITKAMEMVAASKMNKAQEKALRTRPYYTTLHSTLSGIAAATRDLSSPYLQKREEKRVCCVAIAGDRGLAGGYNSNVLRLAAETLSGEENCVVPIGKKAGEYFRHRGVELLTEDWLTAEELSVGGCFTLARHLAGLYRSGQVDAIELVFTRWNSLLSQEPCVLRLLPLPQPEKPGGKREAPRRDPLRAGLRHGVQCYDPGIPRRRHLRRLVRITGQRAFCPPYGNGFRHTECR